MLNYHEDQAAGLRRIMSGPKPRVVSVISANSRKDQPRLLTNLASSIHLNGRDVLIVHASNTPSESVLDYQVDTLPTLIDVAKSRSSLENAIKRSSHGFSVTNLMNNSHLNSSLDSHLGSRLNEVFNKLASEYEVVLVDATLNKDHLLPLTSLNESEIVIQLNRDADSIKQAYVLIKQICSQIGSRPFGILVDGASSNQALTVFKNISQVSKRFMQIDLEFIGSIPSDDHLSRASKLGRAVIEAFPMSIASSAFKEIAKKIDYKNNHSNSIKQASFI